MKPVPTLVMSPETILVRAAKVVNFHGCQAMRSSQAIGAEIDALRVGQAMLTLQGGEFAGGPTYYVARQLRKARTGPEVVAQGEPVYFDTSQDAMRYVSMWLEQVRSPLTRDLLH